MDDKGRLAQRKLSIYFLINEINFELAHHVLGHAIHAICATMTGANDHFTSGYLADDLLASDLSDFWPPIMQAIATDFFRSITHPPFFTSFLDFYY